ncbi:MAG: hypothetical protein ACPMAQ_02190, partial [Phycisphaerae bacterium]
MPGAWGPAGAILAAAILAGLPALRGRFLSGDDRQFVLNFALVNHPSFAHARELLTLKANRDLYQPVPLLSFALDFAVARAIGLGEGGFRGIGLREPSDREPSHGEIGLREPSYRGLSYAPGESAEAAAWLFHLKNVLIHAINALLVWQLIRRVHEDPRVALAAALLFAVHPMAVEPTAWISGRMTSLSAFFCLAALNAFAAWQRRPRPAPVLLGIACVVLAMASKVQIGLPVLMILLAPACRRTPEAARSGVLAPGGGQEGRCRSSSPQAMWWGVVATCVLITIGFALLDMHLTSRMSFLAAGAEALRGSRLARTLLALGWYFQRFVWPAGLASFHPAPSLVTWSQPGVIAAAITVAAVLIVVGVSLRWSRVGVLGLAWFLATVAATLPLVPSRNVLAAERYAYLPNVGLFWMTAAFAVFAYHRLAARGTAAAWALRAGGLPRNLNLLGSLVGAVGILSLVPGLTDLLTGVFGLSQIVWFVWLGIVLLRSSQTVIAHAQKG